MDFLGYLLEKDHRSKMIGFGVPKEVADFLHNFDDKYSIWFANQLKGMEGYQAAKDKVNWIRANLQTDMQGIMDWVRTVPNVMLKNYNWEQAVAEHIKYHNSIETNTLKNAEKNKILKTYADGFYWVDLESNNCPEEASVMGHCARTSADTLWSLRKYYSETNSIDVLITMGVNPDDDKSWQQAKGKRNSKPKADYEGYIADILVSNDIFKFKSEYDTRNDFTDKDLLRYVETHPDKFKDADEVISKIQAAGVSITDFYRILSDTGGDKLKYYSISLDDANVDVYVYAYLGLFFSIPLNRLKINRLGDFIKDISQFSSKNSNNMEKQFLDIINAHIGAYTSDTEIEQESDGDISIKCSIDENDNAFPMDDDGLESFKRVVNSYVESDEALERDMDDIIIEIQNLAILSGYTDDPYGKFITSVDDKINDELVHVATFRKNNDNLNSIVVFEGMSMRSFFSNPAFTNDDIIGKFINDRHGGIFTRSITPWLGGVDLNSDNNKKVVSNLDLPLFYVFEFVDAVTSHGQYGTIESRIINGGLYFYYEYDDGESEKTYEVRLQQLQRFNDDYSSILNKFNKLLSDVILPAGKAAVVYDADTVTWKLVPRSDSSNYNSYSYFELEIFDKKTGDFLDKRTTSGYWKMFGGDSQSEEDLTYQHDKIKDILKHEPIIKFPKLDVNRELIHPNQMSFNFESFYRNILTELFLG